MAATPRQSYIMNFMGKYLNIVFSETTELINPMLQIYMTDFWMVFHKYCVFIIFGWSFTNIVFLCRSE